MGSLYKRNKQANKQKAYVSFSVRSYSPIKGGKRLGRTEYLANFGDPDDSSELDITDGERAVVENVGYGRHELEVGMGEQDALKLGNVS